MKAKGLDCETYMFRSNYEIIASPIVFQSPKLPISSKIGLKKTAEEFGIAAVATSEHVGHNLLDHPIMPHVLCVEDGTALDSHTLRSALAHDAAFSACTNRNKGTHTSGLLEMAGLPRIDSWLEKDAAYTKHNKENGPTVVSIPLAQVASLTLRLTSCLCFAMLFSATFHTRLEAIGTLSLSICSGLFQQRAP